MVIGPFRLNQQRQKSLFIFLFLLFRKSSTCSGGISPGASVCTVASGRLAGVCQDLTLTEARLSYSQATVQYTGHWGRLPYNVYLLIESETRGFLQFAKARNSFENNLISWFPQPLSVSFHQGNENSPLFLRLE